MRQAGRCLAEYRALRERFGILEIVRTPELCARVTAMPVSRLGVDAAVLYADIMLPLDGMGVPFRIEPELGPIVETPVRDARAVDALRVIAAEDATPYLFETIRALRRTLPPEIALIGFCAAPFTLASYLVEGRPSRDYALTKAMLLGEPAIQANLEPAVCLAPWDVVAARADDVLRRANGRPGHVFNLGHGVLAATDADILARLAAHVRDTRITIAA